VVVVEGAGSPAEVNLREGDIANMGFALPARVPVVLAGDIDRGGVLASLVGTWTLLTPEERARIGGFVVNKFRGDPALFADGPEVVTRRTGLRSFGTVPYLAEAAWLPAEDSVSLDSTAPAFTEKCAGKIRIAVPSLPRMSNFDDLDPLAAEPGVEIVVVPQGRALPRDADVILLPGSKATLADLSQLRAEGWDVDIAAHARSGGTVVGLCGGFQMLGTRVADPDGLEGPPAEAEGLGLLEIETVIGGEKTLRPARGRASGGEDVQGYEMHMGETSGKGLARPWLVLDGERNEGAVSEDGRILGCYVHGLFSSDAFRRAFLARLGARATSEPFAARVESALDAIAAKLENFLDVDGLLALARTRS
ncbi:MAG: cobyric acid synthase, partial [Rhodospirillales bacterium]|nr:cobyric acid synthase [Rhodospirillales bacterium]